MELFFQVWANHKANAILWDPCHILHAEFGILQSGNNNQIQFFKYVLGIMEHVL